MADDFNFKVKPDSGVNQPSLATAAKIATAETTPAVQTGLDTSQIDAVHKVSRDLKRIMNSTSRLKPEAAGYLAQVSKWADDYLTGLEAARKLSENSGAALGEAQRELSLALDEFLRLEGEGGNVASPSQQRHTDDLSQALRRINTLIPAMQTTFETTSGPNDPSNPEIEPTEPSAPEVNPVPAPESNPDVLPDIPPVDRPEIAKPQVG
jgi:hypothetical protein